MAEITLDIPSEEPDDAVVLDITASGKKARGSDVGRQALAGVLDLGADLPAFAGLVGAGAQSGFNYLFDNQDKSFKQHFTEAATTGIDSSLLEFGNTLRTGINNLLDITEPQSTEGILARNAALFLPIPGIRLAKGASKLARSANALANITLPTVKRGTKKNMALRGGIQGSIGLGIDQGVRAAIDDPNLPLLFSDKALAGGVEPEGELAQDFGGPRPKGEVAVPIPNHPLDSEALKMLAGNDILRGGADDDIISLDIPSLTAPDAISLDIPSQTRDVSIQDQVDLDARMQKAARWEDVKTFGIIAGALVGGAYLTKRLRGSAPMNAPPKPIEDLTSTQLVHESMADKGKVVDHVFKKQGVDDVTREAVDANTHTDVNGVANQSVLTGIYGQGFDNKKFPSHAQSVLDTDEAVLRQAGKDQAFNDAMKAGSEISVTREGRDPSLWREGLTDQDLMTTFKAGRADKDIKALMDKHAQNARAELEYEVHRGYTTREDADDILKTFGDITTGGTGRYMPFYGKTKVDITRALARKFLGINTKKGDDLQTQARFFAREGGLSPAIMDASEAAQRHKLYNVAHVNEELYKNDVLTKMAGIHTLGDNAGFKRQAIRNGKFVDSSKAMSHNETGRGTHLMGVGHNPKANPENVAIKMVTDDKGVKVSDMSINDLRANKDFGKEIVTVVHRGKLYVYRVPDAGIRAALELSPRMGVVLEFMNHWKNIFTKFTTGEFSLFAPISHAFSSQTVALTTVARQGGKGKRLHGISEGAKSIGRSLGGSKELFLDQSAGIIAEYLARSIATGTGLGRLVPNAPRIQATLHDRFANAMIGRVRSETGRTATGIGSTPSSLEDMLNQHGKVFADFYGAQEMGLIKNVWKAFNNAANEGPAYGVMLKELNEIANPSVLQIRKAVDISKTAAGDMARIGSSKFAKGVHASIPFSSAMVQSWNALGSAAKHDWKAFSMGAGALIGAPTLMELAMNAALSKTGMTFPDPSGNGKSWTYDDYYWNGFTTQQRTDNMIIFVPWRPPWEAIVIPISPEWGLFRSVVMEAADVIFNLSQTGSIGVADDGRWKVGRDHFLGSLHRVFDLPLPPLGAAILSSMGLDIRAGLHVADNDDPEAPSQSLGFFQALPLGTGERITGRLGRTKDVNASLDKETAAWIKDIWGAGGTAYVAFYEAVNAGVTNKDGSLAKGLSGGLGSLWDSARRQARYSQPLFGKVFKPNPNDEIASSLHGKRQSLISLSNEANILAGGTGIIEVDGKQVIADTVISQQDPIRIDLAKSAKIVMNNIAMVDQTISDLKKLVSTARLSTQFGSRSERQDYIDGKNLEIQAYKAQQLGVLHTFEDEWSEAMTKKYQRDITINLSGGVGTTLAARPNLGSTSPGLPTLPRTSQ
jgi:hypothetical protein